MIKEYPHLPFLCVPWLEVPKKPMRLSFTNAATSTSLREVSKGLSSSLKKAMLVVARDLWAAKFHKSDVPT
jgi:hypothetical protein